jgi:hypothetical protein
MDIDEKEAIVKKNIDSIMPIIKKVYGNTEQWETIVNIINYNKINVNGKYSPDIIAYVHVTDIFVTPLYFEEGPIGQKRTLLHELAHLYVTITDPNSSRYKDSHAHPEFINKYVESLKLLGMSIKNPTARKLRHIIYPPTELPSKKNIDMENVMLHNYYCPACEDVFTTTLQNFKKEHAHAFKQ